MENYPAIQASLARLSAREGGVDLARTAYLPSLDYGLQANRATRNNVAGLLLPGTPTPGISGPASDSTSSATAWGSANSLLFSWEVFDFGLRRAGVGFAQTQVTQARASTELTRLDVGVRAAGAFLGLAAAQETVRAAGANVERQEVFAETVAVLVGNELRPGADASRAQAELALARIQLIRAERAEAIARADLAQWLGVAPAVVAIEAGPLLAMAPPPLAAPPDVSAHPLAETQMANVESSRALQDVFRRSYLPHINLQAGYSARGSGALADGTIVGGTSGLNVDAENRAVGVTLTFPLFGRFAARERVTIEERNERAEVATYDQIVQELSAQTEQARAEMEGARRVAENTPIQLEAARVLEQQSRASYEAGLSNIVEIADAQRLLLQAEVGDAVAQLDVWRARVAEAAATGDLSEFFQ